MRPPTAWRGPVSIAASRLPLLLIVLILGLCLGAAASGQPVQPVLPSPPELRFEAPPGLEGKVEQLERFDTDFLVDAMVLLGLRDPGPPIRVLVAPEGSAEARRAPSWAQAYAIGQAGVIVLIPGRVPSYPDGDLFQTLQHEVLHVLVSRAAGRRPVPRWFNEGLAMVGSHEWRLEDHGRLVLAAFSRRQASMDDVSEGFGGGGSAASSAYVVSAAFVRWMLEEYGQDSAAMILERVAVGQEFDDAVEAVTFRPLRELEKAFWAHLGFWNRWVPFLSSSAFVWLVATGLFLAAAARRRARSAERMREWEEEEAAELAAMPTDPYVH